MSMPNNTVLHEYDAVRDEILLRLKFQQQIIQFTFLAVGLLGPLLSIQSFVALHSLLAALLIGPILCIFLQLIYYKQHIFIELLSDYIATDLGAKGERSEKDHSFKGWERYLTKSLYIPTLPNWFSGLLGFAEGMFPVTIGGLYLIIIVALGVSFVSQLNVFWTIILTVWFIVDLTAMGITVFGGFIVRDWASELRKEAVNKMSEKLD